VDRATRFVNAVLWERWEAERLERERHGHAAPARVSDARIDLYRDCAAAVSEDPAGLTAQRLVARWQAILDGECGGDAETIDQQVAAWRSRRTWAPAMRRYMASCYAMDVDSWLHAADFLEAALDRSLSSS
jgi:hypothetical protein